MSSTSQTDPPTHLWDAANYAANGRFVANLADEVFTMLNARAGERVLDLGCGDGALTERIAATGAAVVACDASESMLAAAAARGLHTVRADMRSLPFTNEFDAVFSNAALHWVTDQDAVLRGVHAALTPGGRFVAEMGGHGNIASIRVALASVLRKYGVDAEHAAASFYPSIDACQHLLREHGFRVQQMELILRPTLIASGMAAWLRTFRHGVLEHLTERDRMDAITATCDMLEPVLRDSTGTWWADYVRLRFAAIKDA